MIQTDFKREREDHHHRRNAPDASDREPFDPTAPHGGGGDFSQGGEDQFATPTLPELVAQATELLGPDDCYPAKVTALLRDYDARWVERAIQTAGERRSTLANAWAYAVSILRRWKTEGGPDKPTPRRGPAPMPHAEVQPREIARSQSAGCLDCDGHGLATRYYHEPHPEGRTHAVLYCRCAMGQWLHQAHQGGSEALQAIRGRISRLEDHPSLWRAPVSWSGQPDHPRCYPVSVWRDIERGANGPESLRTYTGTPKPEPKRAKGAA